MPNYDLLEVKDPQKLQTLKDIWEPRKEFIEKDLWVIRNFLSEEELEWLNKEAIDPNGWYPTMRSPYGGNIRNKFLGYVPEYGEDGILIPPHPKNNPVFVPVPFLNDIEDRLESVLPKYFAGAGALQSFFEVSEDEPLVYNPDQKVKDVDWAMGWHYERDDEDTKEKQFTIVAESSNKAAVMSETIISASFNVYINDNFNGGILEFKNKDYSIKPEPGMLINIPLYKEFEHRVTKVTKGNRHTLYGRCWEDINKSFLSSREDC
jgi:hypothetical protein